MNRLRSAWPWVKQGVLVLVVYEAYSLARSKVQGATPDAFRHARSIVKAERWLHISVERTMQGWVLPHRGLTRFWNVYYGSVHFVVPVVALALLFARFPPRYRRWRNALGAMTLLALLGFAFYPVMPPRLMPPRYHFVDTSATVGGIGAIGAPEAKEGFSNIYAAMPSLHIGWSSWCAFALVPAVRRRWLKALAALYPFVTLFAIAVTANHWILDGVGGLVWLSAGYGAARLWERVRPTLITKAEASQPSPT